MRFRFPSALCGLLVAFAATLPAPPVFAQATPAPAAISDAKLQAFVVAAMKVNGLIEQWTPKIEAAPTPEEKTKLKQTANAELLSAIQSSGGLTLPEYREIGQAVESDPALQERIAKLLQESGPQKQ